MFGPVYYILGVKRKPLATSATALPPQIGVDTDMEAGQAEQDSLLEGQHSKGSIYDQPKPVGIGNKPKPLGVVAFLRAAFAHDYNLLVAPLLRAGSD